jgi:TatD DNase family protein
MLIDSHSHLFQEEFAGDLPEVMERAREAGVTHIFMPNIDSTTIEPMLSVCRQYPDLCYPMIGLHPTSVTEENYREELKTVERELERREERGYVAIGEIGMDLYWDKTYREQQLYVFEAQIEMALKHSLPIVIHAREAMEEVCTTLDKYRDTKLTGVFHSFTGTADEVERLLGYERFMIGVNGVVTFKKSPLPESLQRVPLSRLLTETDSPYLTPVPYRGRRNESAYVTEVTKKVAEVYGVDCETVSRQTSENALKLFKRSIKSV